MADPTASATAEVTGIEHQVDLRITSAPTMTIGPRTVTPVGVRIAYEDSEVVVVRIDGRGPSGFVDYYPLNDPSDWPEWLAALVEEHQPVERATVRVAALAEAADALQLHIDTKWAGPDREGQRRLWLYPLVDLVRRLAMPH